MGSRILVVSIQILNFYFLFFIYAVITSCQPPSWINVKYNSGYKDLENYDLTLVGGLCELKITGRIHRHSTQIFQLFVEAQYKKGAATEFKFKLNAPTVIINNFEVSYPSVDKMHEPLASINQEYISPFPSIEFYDCRVPNGGLIHNIYGELESVSVKIVLDSFVYYRGNLVPLDTIRGMLY